MKENNPELSRLLEKYRKGLCTEDEKQQLHAWLNELERSSGPMPLPGAEKRAALRDAFVGRVTASPRRNARIIPFKRYVAAAVILACVCLSATFFLFRHHNNTSHAVAAAAWDTLSTHAGEIRSIKLSDNSIVALNANTRIRISKTYGKDNRKLELIDGEAWFDVQKDARLPFTVQCGRTETRVLGTRFVISAYKALPDIAVHVTEGRVAVGLPDKTVPVINAYEYVRLDKATGKSTQDEFARGVFDPLKKSCFIQNGSFDELALRIKNAYGVTLVPKTPEARQRRFTGEFSYTENIGNVIRKFSEIHGRSYEMQGDTIIME